MTRLVAIAGFSARHPRRVIAGWLVFVIVALAAGAATGTRPLPNGAVGESARGYAIMDRHRAYPSERAYLLLRSSSLRAGDLRFGWDFACFVLNGDGDFCPEEAFLLFFPVKRLSGHR